MKPGTKMPMKLLRLRLEEEGVESYFNTLATAATNIEIRAKRTLNSHSSAVSGTVEETKNDLIAGDITSVQIRYTQDNVHWCDTLTQVKDSFRLVRMKHS